MSASPISPTTTGHERPPPLPHADARGEAPRIAHSSRLPWTVKLAYAIGETTVGIRQSAVVIFLLPFYTDVALLSPAIAGIALALGRVWDACSDPVIGYLSDQTRTRLGRRRPYLLVSAIPLGFAFAAIWSPPANVGQWMLAGYVLGTFFLLDVCYGLYSTPHLALGAEMSDDYHERTQIAVLRAVFHNLGIFLGGGILPVIVAMAASPRQGYRTAGIAFGVVMSVSALIAFLGSREQSVTAPRRQVGFRRFLAGTRTTLENHAFRILLASFALLLFGASLNQSFAVYMFRDAFGVGARMPLIMTVYLGATTASLPLWGLAARRFGKNRAFEACLTWSIVILGSTMLLPTRPSIGGLLSFLTLAGLGNGGYVIPVAIAADVVDDDELRTHERREGAFFGVWTWTMKLAAALAVAAAGISLPWLGYVAGAAQSSTTVLALKLVWGPLSALFFVAALVVFRRFPITKLRHHEIQIELARRRLAAR